MKPKKKNDQKFKLIPLFIPLENTLRLAAELYHILRTRGLIPHVSPVRDRSLNRVSSLTGFILFLLVGMGVLGFGNNVKAANVPVLHFSDLISGPKTGLDDGLGQGAIVTI